MTKTTLAPGGTGTTGRRIVHRLTTRGLPAPAGSRSGQPPFDRDDQSTRAPAPRDLTDGAERAPGRRPPDLSQYPRDAIGIWNR